MPPKEVDLVGEDVEELPNFAVEGVGELESGGVAAPNFAPVFGDPEVLVEAEEAGLGEPAFLLGPRAAWRYNMLKP